MEYDYVNAQSWIPSFEQLFHVKKINKILEYGEGKGTQWLLDSCGSVTSVEVVAKDEHMVWGKFCEEQYGKAENWKQVYYECSSLLKEFDELCRRGLCQIYSNISDKIKKSVKELLLSGLDQCKDPDLIFIDAGVHFRGTMLNVLFDMITKKELNRCTLAAHDTNVLGVYGWDKVIAAKGYREFVYPSQGLQTKIWKD